MHYPWWYVPHATAPMLIAAIAVVHVLVSHYAVGGGLFLAVEIGHAYKKKDDAYVGYLRSHARFFILLTIVFGSLTGVGIWWTIGLASPLATEMLIRTFVFGWAIEWTFFVVEIVSAFLFYYYWGRLPKKLHLTIGWIYAIAAWISLVLIAGIMAFMLNPGNWTPQSSFWTAFFNPQFIPQTVARTGGALLLTSLYVFLHASIFLKDDRLRDMIGHRSARPAVLGAVMVILGGIGWFVFLPESAAAVLERAAALNIMVGLLFASTGVVFALLYIGPYKNPGWLSPGFAGALFLFGTAAFCAGEFIREGVRKPYVVYNVVFSNQILPEEVSKLRTEGYLEGGTWTKAYVSHKWPEALVDGKIDSTALAALPTEARHGIGEVLFQYHCNDCHALEHGYVALLPLIRGNSSDRLTSSITHLDEVHYFMPPWAGTKVEARLLADYLVSISPPRPGGMAPEERKQVAQRTEEAE